uniref:Uncharacterized protein n=1 Tax=Phlebotomus papatasi TaxID=29031 RepID=A0A1B0DMR1_PHLPP
MDDKIGVPEALGKNRKPARDCIAPKRQKLEEKMKEVSAKDKDGLYAIRVLTEQKLILQKKIPPMKEKILLTPDSPLISNLVSPDVSQGTDLAAFDPINSLSKQIQEYPEFSLKCKKTVEKLRADLREKDAKVRELQAECDKSDRIIRDMIESNHRKNLELELKLRSLK